MERIALVTGSEEGLSGLGRALERSGYAVSRASTPAELIDLAAALSPGTVSCYVQLPFAPDVEAESPVARLAGFLATALTDRLEAAAAVAPLLRPDAMVALVAGDDPPEGTPDDAHARFDLLRLISRAVGAGSRELKSVVLEADRSPEEIAAMAARKGEDRQWLHSRVTAISPELNFADWRQELLGLTPEYGSGGGLV